MYLEFLLRDFRIRSIADFDCRFNHIKAEILLRNKSNADCTCIHMPEQRVKCFSFSATLMNCLVHYTDGETLTDTNDVDSKTFMTHWNIERGRNVKRLTNMLKIS